jgi:hypothetical protein
MTTRRTLFAEEVAVVADQQHRAGILGQPLLQQVEGLEIVGRLVKHQQVGWPGEGAGKGKPSTLAAGQHADRGPGLRGAEQEILHVTDHMAALAADGHGVAAAGKCLSQALARVEGFAPLIENNLSEVGAEPDLAAFGFSNWYRSSWHNPLFTRTRRGVSIVAS